MEDWSGEREGRSQLDLVDLLMDGGKFEPEASGGVVAREGVCDVGGDCEEDGVGHNCSNCKNNQKRSEKRK